MNLLLLTLTLTCAGASGSGIVGGSEAPPHSRPYMVSLQQKGSHVCGGMLIRKDLVLTSAHCIKYSKPCCMSNNVTVQGMTDPKHLNITQPDYDIMLLKLKTPARLNKEVKVIALQTDNGIKDTLCSVSGWGMIQSKSSAADVLMEATVTYKNSRVCKEKWQHYFYEDQMICTHSGGKEGICQGDSGGPLVCNKMAFGVVAYNFAEKCDHPRVPHVYMKIPFFWPWIKSVMNGYGTI